MKPRELAERITERVIKTAFTGDHGRVIGFERGRVQDAVEAVLIAENILDNTIRRAPIRTTLARIAERLEGACDSEHGTGIANPAHRCWLNDIEAEVRSLIEQLPPAT